MYTLTEINIYPVKSLSGISLKSSAVEERGLKYDRRWMLVYEDGMFFTQRDHPQMALLQPVIEDGCLKIFHKQDKTKAVSIPPQRDSDSEISVVIWDDKVNARTYSGKIDEWFSDILGFKCRLVYMPDTTNRKVDPGYAKNKIVSFADGYPLLIIGEKSLFDLNKRMDVPLPMNRFRPNLVFSGGNPFDEDKWKSFQIDRVRFKTIKPCSRCVITTTDQDTTERGHEPLKTLATFRNQNGHVMFGMNVIPESLGEITLGNEIKSATGKRFFFSLKSK